MFDEKIIDLDTKVFVKKIIVTLVFEINSSILYAKKIFDKTRYKSSTLDYYTGPKIWYLGITIFLQGFYLVDIIFKDKYS